MKDFEKIKTLLAGKINILITTHVRPDADAIGSSLALFHFLNKSGFHASLVLPNAPAEYYQWFPGIDEAFIFDKNAEKIKQIVSESELIAVVDFSQLSRNGELGKLIASSSAPKIVIDHHPEPEMIFDAYCWDISYCAAAEAVFELLEFLDEKMLKDKIISECIYAALIADSGSFSYSGVSPGTHLIAAKLMENGIDHSRLDKLIFKSFTSKRLFFWGYCLSEKLTLFYDERLAVIAVSAEEFNRFQTDYTDTENLVNMPMMIEKVRVSVLIVERGKKIKLSFRSKGDIPVNEVAKDYFEGGGHKNAAGGDSLLSLEKTVELVVEKVKGFLEGFHEN